MGQGFTVNDRRGSAAEDTPASDEVCRICGSTEVHSREYNKPTMACVEFFRARIQVLSTRASFACHYCNDTGAERTAAGPLPCENCPKGDTVAFRIKGIDGTVTGAEAKQHLLSNSPDPMTSIEYNEFRKRQRGEAKSPYAASGVIIGAGGVENTDKAR